MSIEPVEGITGAISMKARRPGPRVIVFGGVHGNEAAGITAVEKVTSDFSSDALTLLNGSVVLVGANEHAIRSGERYVRYDLNRLFKDSYDESFDTDAYEYVRAQTLKPLLRECDYFLDLHSAASAREPFLICEAGPALFFRMLGLPKIVTGWSSFAEIGGDTENYANAHGAIAATLESGGYTDPASVAASYATIIDLLTGLDMLEGAKKEKTPVEAFDLYKVVLKKNDDFRYLVSPENFLTLPKGAAYASQGGKELTVTEDSYLIIPAPPERRNVGQEICYLGRKVS